MDKSDSHFPFVRRDISGDVLYWKFYFHGECLAGDPRVAIINELAKFFLENREKYLWNKDEIARTGVVQLNYKSVMTDIPVQEFDTVLKVEPSTVLSSLAIAVHHAMIQLSEQHVVRFMAERVFIRLEGYVPLTSMRSLKSNYIDRFISLRGNVVRVGNIKPLVLGMNFSCSRCGLRLYKQFEDGRFEPPAACEGTCKSRQFVPERASATTVDWQRIKIQEIVGGGQKDQGRIPRTIECELRDELVDGCIPGDIVTISGIVKARKVKDAGNSRTAQKSLFLLYVSVNCVENGNKNQNGKLDVFKFTVNDYKMVNTIWQTPDLFKLLVHSLCPSIYGNEVVKGTIRPNTQYARSVFFFT